MTLTQIAASLTAVGVIGGGALTLDRMHVASGEFEKHLEYQESRYILEIKEDIRDIRKALAQNPADEYLNEYLANLIDELCELRPDDRECKD